MGQNPTTRIPQHSVSLNTRSKSARGAFASTRIRGPAGGATPVPCAAGAKVAGRRSPAWSREAGKTTRPSPSPGAGEPLGLSLDAWQLDSRAPSPAPLHLRHQLPDMVLPIPLPLTALRVPAALHPHQAWRHHVKPLQDFSREICVLTEGCTRHHPALIFHYRCQHGYDRVRGEKAQLLCSYEAHLMCDCPSWMGNDGTDPEENNVRYCERDRASENHQKINHLKRSGFLHKQV